ncbi:F-box only protein 40-like isoform X2 [Brienomyrus brachyistius]|uniref:F-box only protein 40-like isoform X2 n=1 Tax=Brienomyrus brachyistius TaxID=42636 RepID=UPI0020B38A6D|nr:F-box only protein 40-like isoform X2 [Brienomyrus brachyistius]
MRRNRRPVVREHQHCERCFRLNCKAPIEIPVSCMVISCRLLCGATFHMCKEEEHRLLCPKETVSCLNAAYGCPATMLRSQLAQHLKVCPASVISCSMDWNRWPIADTDGMFYKNAVKEPFSDEHLDLCMALRDQKLVCNKLKVKAFFPELMEDVEEAEDSAEGAMGGVDPTDDESTTWISDCSSAMSDMQELMAKNKDGLDIRNHELAEKMFSKEKGGCMQAAKAKVDGQTPANQQKTQGSSSHQQAEETCRDKNEPETETTDATHIGFAPWDEGVLERLGKETMREMCATLLKDRGMVSLKWKKKTYAHGGSRWKSQKVWQFSNLFSTVDKWSFAETLSMSEHLKRCSFYQTERKTEPVALIQMCDKKMKR